MTDSIDVPVGGDPADAVIDKEQVMASFASIEWDTYSRTLLDAAEVRGREMGGWVHGVGVGSGGG